MSNVTVYVLVGYCTVTKEAISQPFTDRVRAEQALQERIEGTRPGQWSFRLLTVDL